MENDFSIHESFMRRCLSLASLGLGRVQPNPLVGAVLVARNKIIGEGWHREYGKSHAEIDAIRSVKDPELIKESTLYVNLEPCSHYGKTPPCAEAIISYGIPKVVIGNIDPNAKVNGQGIRMLNDAGIETVTHILDEQCKELNKRFLTYHLLKRPYIILKWARTADGFMDVAHRNPEDIGANWITNRELRTIVHKWRSEEDAILVGYNTWKNDRPQLTTRYYPGKNPKRFVISNQKASPETDLSVQFLPDHIKEASDILYREKIQSVIVEGGPKTLYKFLDAGLWDEIRILTGDQYWEEGLPAPSLNLAYDAELKVTNNTVHYVRRHL